MLPLLAALPAVFSAIGSVVDLFDEGKKVYEQVTGKPSVATTAPDLEAEVRNLTPDQQATFAAAMQGKIEMYKAENERLKNEQGEVDAATLSVLPEATRAKIAEQRMTTRPWVVRMMTHFLLTPAYAVWYDGSVIMAQNLLKLIDAIFGTKILWSPLLLVDQFMIKTEYRAIYTEAVPWLIACVIGYMGLRSGEKSQAAGGAGGIAGALSGLVSSIGSLRGGGKK